MILLNLINKIPVPTKIMEKSTLSHKRPKLQQADWPLGSKKNCYLELAQYFTKKSHNQKHDILAHGKQITLTVEKGTNRISYFSNSKTQLEETRHYSTQKHVCDTCKEEIPDISRILIMHDKDAGPRLLCYHFFFPCWDMELLCQKYPNLIIDRTGLSFPENLVMSKSSIKKIQKNQEFWI